MEAYFDNKGNMLNASIRITRDQSPVYTLKTTFGLRGRKITILRDENPPPGRAANVGSIFWRDKVFEIYGQRKPISEIRRTEGRIFKRVHHWKWSSGRKEYELRHDDEGWKAMLNKNMSIAARLLVPLRPHLFGKSEPPSLHLTKAALDADEIFLILVMIYCELKRQDGMNSSLSNGGA